MTNRKTLYEGISCAAWGYFFLWFDFKLNTVSITPSFVGYLLFLSAIRYLTNERRDLVLLGPLGMLLALWHGADWLASWAGITLSGRFPPLDLIFCASSLYFHFQLLTDLAALATTYQLPEKPLDRSLLRYRTIQTLLTTAVFVITVLPEGNIRNTAAMALVFIGVIVSLTLMILLFSLRKLFRDGGP